jgi:YVTN family beta-propeller protein
MSARRFWMTTALTLGLAASAAAQGRPYTKIGEIHIGGTVTGFDYLEVDSAAKRLYVSNSTSVVVIDLATNAMIGRLPAGARVHGIAIAPNGRGFISNGGDNNVSIVDLKTLQPIAKVPAGANPDAILYEPSRKEIYALNHTGKSATVIASETGAVVATIPLSGTAETGRADLGLGRVYVNIEDKDAIDVIDVRTHTVIATWSVAPASEPTGMAIDVAHHRLFVGGGSNTVMIDGTSGKVLASMPIVSGTDATWFDPGTQMVFSSGTGNGGQITAGHVDAPDRLTVVQTIATLRGARTMALDPATHHLFVVGQDYAPNGAAVADSFHVLVLGPGQ